MDDVANVEMDQQFLEHARGSIFFSSFDDDHVHVLLVLDEPSGDFSTITLPLALDGLVDDRENL